MDASTPASLAASGAEKPRVAVWDQLAAVRQGLSETLIDRGPLVDRLLVALLADGHLLIEGAPGLAKTRAVKSLARSLQVSFARIQCTPDLMPADITGTPVWRPGLGAFEFVPGPLFHAFVLVDEINRAPPKVQSALLEAMGERQVTAGSATYALPEFFMVLATQNPIEHEGTYPLPEAQLDRFLLHVTLGFPDAAAERAILDLAEQESAAGVAEPPVRLDPAAIRAAREEVRGVYVSPALKDYVVRLVTATRDGRAGADIREAIEFPVSPRGTLALAASARALAYLQGRDHVTPDDVEALAVEALSHRLRLTWRAAAEGETAPGLVRKLLERVSPL